MKINYAAINAALAGLGFPAALISGGDEARFDFTLRVFVDNPSDEMVQTAVSCVNSILSGVAWEYDENRR